MAVKDNQPALAAHVVEQCWNFAEPDAISDDQGHGRIEKRSLWVIQADPESSVPRFSSAKQMILIQRCTTKLDGSEYREEFSYSITSRSQEDATPEELLGFVRGHWGIENRCHWVRDVTFDEDRSRVRSGSGPQVMATLRNLAISAHRMNGESNIAAATRACANDATRAWKLLAGRSRAQQAA